MSRRGFTLVEVLVSIALGMTLSGLCLATFLQLRSTVRRAHARLELHNAARFLQHTLAHELAALQQDAALWIETKRDSGAGDGSIRLTFLKAKTDNADFTFDLDYGAYTSMLTDLVWAQWSFDQRLRALSTGASSTYRQFNVGVDWIAAPGRNFRDHRFRSLPTPRREAGPDARTVLDRNRWGSPDPADIGDYTDLERRSAPVMTGVVSVVFELVLEDGTTVRADTTADQTIALDGCFVDARVPAAGTRPSRRRPRLIRVLVELVDRGTGLTQPFSFSFQPPAQLPALR